MFDTHLDAARSRVIGRALRDPLCELRAALEADVSYLIFRRNEASSYDVVAGDCDDERQAFLSGEAILCRQKLNVHLPQSVSHLTFDSKLRRFSSDLVSALVVPWRHSEGQAWLVIGNLSMSATFTNISDNARVLDLLEAVKRQYVSGSARGSRTLNRVFRQSMRRLSDAERSCDTSTLLSSIPAIARWLFDTSSAYLALPANQGDKFNFVATERVRTAEFRELSLGLEEGIGGLARRTRSPVSTTDYASDRRLSRAPLKETDQEGFKSAACTPLWWDGRVSGLLYIAQRKYRAFNQIDLSLLEQFANESADALSLDQRRQFQADNIRLAEREQIANKLHDSVVRYLLDLGMTAHMSLAETDIQSFRATLERIKVGAQMCLDAVRDCISEGSYVPGAAPVAVGAIAAQLQAVQLKNDFRRHVALGPDCSSSLLLPTDVASALAVIGREALYNAERHSNGTFVRILIDRSETEIFMQVEDDGGGLTGLAVADLLDRPGHLGLQRMRNVAHAIGGNCRFERAVRGGMLVLARFPLQTRYER